MELLPYLVATQALQRRLDLEPLGHVFPPELVLDPTRRASGPFLDLLEKLDAATFGREGMAMPRWAFYDCAELPGAVAGLGCAARHAPPDARAAFGDVSDDTFLPLSMYMAIPTLTEHEWLGYSLCSLELPSSAFLGASVDIATLALSVTALRAKLVTGTVQWSSPHLGPTARFAPLSVLAAWLPAHTRAETCVFRFDVDRDRLERALASEVHAEGDVDWLSADDRDAHHVAQARIEAGERCFIVGVPERDPSGARVPVRWEKAR